MRLHELQQLNAAREENRRLRQENETLRRQQCVCSRQAPALPSPHEVFDTRLTASDIIEAWRAVGVEV
jgi:hypothetical protein